MSLDIGTLQGKISLDNEEAKQALSEVGKAANNMGEEINKSNENSELSFLAVSQACETLANTMGKVASIASNALGQAINAGSDLEENISKANVVFGTNADAIERWADAAIDSMGMAKSTALEAASAYGDLGSSMGIAQEQNAAMATTLVQLSADMASFKNISIERAQSALNAIYTGETESLKAMGIVMTEANLQLFAQQEGITKQLSAMTQQEKVMLRYKYVLAQTANAQGDFARTSDGVANQSRKLQENITELAASFGEQLQEKASGALEVLNKIITWVSNFSPATKEIIITIGEVIVAVAGVASGIAMVSKAWQALNAVMASNPIMLAIMAATAAITALIALIGTISGAVDKAKKECDELATNYKANIKATVNVEKAEDADANAEQIKVELLEKVGNITAVINGVKVDPNGKLSEEDKKKCQDAIDTILKDADLKATIAQIDPNIIDDLSSLEAKLASGQFYPDDLKNLGETLKKIETIAKETPTITINASVTGIPVADLETIKEDVTALWGLTDSKQLTLEVVADNAITVLGDMKEEIDNLYTEKPLEAFANSILEARKETIMNISYIQYALLKLAYDSGTISFDEYKTKLVDITETTKEQLQQTEEGVKAWQEVVSAEGVTTEEAVNAMLIATGYADEAGNAIAQTGQSIGQTAAETIVYLDQLKEAGASDEELAYGYQLLQTELGNTVTSYEAAASAAVEASHAQEAAIIADAQAAKEANENAISGLKDAWTAYTDLADDAGSTVEERFATLKTTNKEAYDNLVALYGSEEELLAANKDNAIDLYETTKSTLEGLQAQNATIVSDAEAKIKTEQENLQTTLKGLADTYQIESLNNYVSYLGEYNKTTALDYATRITDATEQTTKILNEEKKRNVDVKALMAEAATEQREQAVADASTTMEEVGKEIGSGLDDIKAEESTNAASAASAVVKAADDALEAEIAKANKNRTPLNLLYQVANGNGDLGFANYVMGQGSTSGASGTTNNTTNNNGNSYTINNYIPESPYGKYSSAQSYIDNVVK